MYRTARRIAGTCGVALAVLVFSGCGPHVPKEDLGEVVLDKIPEVPGAKKTFAMPELDEKTESGRSAAGQPTGE